MLPEREPNDHEWYMRTIATAWFKNELNEVAAGYEWQSAALFLTARCQHASPTRKEGCCFFATPLLPGQQKPAIMVESRQTADNMRNRDEPF